MKNPLLDKDFLLKLDETRERETFVRLIALTIDESPIETIEGRATQGSLNIDGKSAVRRTCSLSLVANEMNINDFYWGLNSKFKLEIGIKNKIDDTFPEIIWFPFGTYLITSFNTSQNINSYNISISGKDKMCLLNGEIGGSITSLTADFGTYDDTDNKGNKVIKKHPLKNIIREGVHAYGNEPFHNIIINDLDDYGLELKEYRGDVPMYLFKENGTDEFVQMTLNGNTAIDINGNSKNLNQLIQTEDYDKDNLPIEGAIPFNFDLRNSFTGEEYYPTEISLSDKKYTIAKLEYGDTPGYTLTDLVFAGDLILSVGDPFTDVLDKIVGMLGGFEYFYDVYGRFIFQKKKVYTSTSWNNLKEEDGKVYGENAALTSALTYSFEDSKLVQTFSNNPDLINLRNDFSVWGTRKSATGNEIPVHMRYAIDKKPIEYCTIEVTQEEADMYNKFYKDQTKKPQQSIRYAVDQGWDWREIIYQMALDFRLHNHLDGFEAKVAAANPELYPTGKTGYEQYYTDMEGFWRQLYNPDYKAEYSSRTFTEDTSKERFVKGFIPIEENDLEYDKYYCFYGDDNYLVKYIDSIPYDEIFYTDNKGEKPVVDGIDLKNYIVYWKKDDGKYQRYIDYKEETDESFSKEKIYIQISSKSYAPVLDYFKIINLTTEEKEKEWDKIYILLNNIYKEVSVFIKKEDKYEQLKKLSDIISADKVNLFYKIRGSADYVAALETYFYIKKERDIKDKILYIQLEDKSYTPYNNEIDVIDRQNNVWIQVGERKVSDDIKEPIWRHPIELLKVDRGNLYIQNENKDFVLFKLSNVVVSNSTKQILYKVNDSENFYSVKNYEEQRRSLYIKKYKENDGEIIEKYQRYLYSPNFTVLGTTTDYYPILMKTVIPYYEEYYDFDTKTHWNYAVQNAPETLNFWIDFLDTDGELSQYSIPVVGNRSKSINDSLVKAIYFRDIPNVLFTDNINAIADKKSGYNYIQLQKGMQAMFINSSQGKSAKDVVEENLYAHAYCTESISATVIPVYYLEPNTRIFIRDDNSKINGEYILNRMSISLAYNGMMNISANKAIERILY